MFWYRNNTRHKEAEVLTSVFKDGHFLITVKDLVDEAVAEGRAEYDVRLSYLETEITTNTTAASVLSKFLLFFQ